MYERKKCAVHVADHRAKVDVSQLKTRRYCTKPYSTIKPRLGVISCNSLALLGYKIPRNRLRRCHTCHFPVDLDAQIQDFQKYAACSYEPRTLAD